MFEMSVKTEAILKTILQIVVGLCAFAAFAAIVFFVLTFEPIVSFLDKYLIWIIIAAMVGLMAWAGISVLYDCNLKNVKARRTEKKEES